MRCPICEAYERGQLPVMCRKQDMCDRHRNPDPLPESLEPESPKPSSGLKIRGTGKEPLPQEEMPF